MRFVRRRFGHYHAIDFVAVLLGYVINGEQEMWDRQGTRLSSVRRG